MKMTDVLADGAMRSDLDDLARRFGLTPQQAQAVIGSVLPEVLRRLERNSLSRGGVADLLSMLGQAQAAPPDLATQAGRDRGNAFLEQVFGNRDGSRAVASRAASASGVGASIISAMLPYIIQMVMSAFARRTSGGLGDILSKIPSLGGGAPAPSGQSGDMPLPMPSGSGRGGGFGGGFPGGSGSPLPGPEGMSPPGQVAGRNPYGDLSDIVRRGGSGGSSVGGGTLWRTVRSILGSAMGFQSRGIMSWIVRMIVMRYGWGILQSILRRALSGGR
jgi:hypothetical protein